MARDAIQTEKDRPARADTSVMALPVFSVWNSLPRGSTLSAGGILPCGVTGVSSCSCRPAAFTGKLTAI